MGLIKSISSFFKPQAANPGPLDDFWYTTTPYRTTSGVYISPDMALKVTAVYACVRLLSENGGSVPCYLYQSLGEGGKEHAKTHALYNVLLYQPNDYQTPMEFWEQIIRCCCLRGYFYAKIETDLAGEVKALIPLHPDRVSLKRISESKYIYSYCNYDGKMYNYFPFELFRVMYMTEEDGMTPISPIKANADSVAVTESAERYAASYFGNSAMPGGTLESDGKLSDEARKAIRQSWNREYRGPDSAGKIAVLDQGLRFKQITINNDDSQLLETRQWQLTDICRIFRVPPHLVQDLTRSTFSNIEHQSLDFATYTMRPWFRRIEQAITRDLLLPDERSQYFANFNLVDLLAADAKARSEYNASGIQNGWLTRNEARILEGLNPLEGLDEPLMPSNLRGLNEPMPSDPVGQQSTNKGT